MIRFMTAHAFATTNNVNKSFEKLQKLNKKTGPGKKATENRGRENLTSWFPPVNIMEIIWDLTIRGCRTIVLKFSSPELISFI